MAGAGTDRQIERQTDRKKDRQTNKGTDKQIDKLAPKKQRNDKDMHVDQMEQKWIKWEVWKKYLYVRSTCLCFLWHYDIPRCVWAWISWKCNRQTTLPLLAQQEWHHTSEIPRKASNDGTSPDNKQIVHELHSYNELLERKRKHNIYPKYFIVAWF